MVVGCALLGAYMGIKRWCCLTSVAYIGPKSRTERPMKTKIGTEVAHVTRDSDTTFKVKRSRSPRPLYSLRRLRIRQLQRWPWERIHRGNLLLRCGQARSARRREALRRPQREERGGAYYGGSRTASVEADTIVYTVLMFFRVVGYRSREMWQIRIQPQLRSPPAPTLLTMMRMLQQQQQA